MDFLLVDDDHDYLVVLKRQLEKHGFSCKVAYSGEMAVGCLDQYNFVYLTLDLNLGQDTGVRWIAPFLAKDPNLKIIVITGFASLKSAVDAIKLGAWQYLPKPIRAQDILSIISPNNTAPEKPLNPSSLYTLEWEHIQTTLQACDYNISKAAEILGLSRRTLQRKLKKRML